MAKVGVEIATELKLGLPGSSSDKKRVFSEVETNNNKSTPGFPLIGLGLGGTIFKRYVKVSMDGAPFLRKIDLCMQSAYSDLAKPMENLFACYGSIDGENCSQLMPIYQDKDGDWMLVGDVPWQMFMETCNRLRIMKKSEAKGFGVKGGCKDDAWD